MSKAIAVIIFSAFIAFGGFTSYLVVKNVQNGKASMKWPVATGKVASSKVTKHVSHRRGYSDTVSYWAEVTYKFSVKSKEYSGTQISYDGDSFDTRSEAVAAAKPYPAGGVVDVHYDPINPTESVLQPGGGGGYTSLYFTIPFGLIGLVLLIINLIKWSRAGEV